MELYTPAVCMHSTCSQRATKQSSKGGHLCGALAVHTEALDVPASRGERSLHCMRDDVAAEVGHGVK